MKTLARNFPLTNRTFEMPADGWYQVTGKGEYHNAEADIWQVVDELACRSILNRFAEEKAAGGPNWPGMLIDQDHFSLDLQKPSEAYGWADELQNRESGIWAHVKWTDLGEAAVRGGRYRLISPVFPLEALEVLGNRRVRPLALSRLAVTNDPQMRGMKPLSNRSGETADNQAEKGKSTMDYKQELMTLVGAAAGSSDEDLAKAIAQFKEKMAGDAGAAAQVPELTNRNTALLTLVVDADLAALGDLATEPEKAELKKGLLANRDSMLPLLTLFKSRAADRGGKKPLFNRERATPPVDGAPTAQETKQALQAKAIRNRAAELQSSGAHGRNYQRCWNQAESEVLAAAQ